MSIRTRFALWISTLTLVALAAFGSFVYFTASGWLSSSLDESLRLSATQLVASSDIDHGKLDVSDDPVTLNAALIEELRSQGFSVQLFSVSGALLQSVGSHSGIGIAPAALADALAGHPGTATRDDPVGGGQVRVHTEPVSAAGRVIAVAQVSQSLATINALRERLLVALLLGAPIVVVLAGAGGYLLARRTLAPIDRITGTAGRIAREGDLSRRLDLPPSRDEVGRLAATLDAMLVRLDEAFQRERRFANDAAHELRTPLAAMQSILGVVAQRRRSVDEYEAALADLAEETARLGTLTEDLLRLARAEYAIEPAEAVDLATLLPDVVDSMRPVAEEKGLALGCEVSGDLAIVGDSDSLIRLFLNLVDNALKYTPEGSVEVTAAGSEDAVTVQVRDTGRGISPEQLPHVFERFFRAEEARASSGTGLGLAICAEIVHAHGGTIEAASDGLEGTTFIVTLPRAGRAVARSATARQP